MKTTTKRESKHHYRGELSFIKDGQAVQNLSFSASEVKTTKEVCLAQYATILLNNLLSGKPEIEYDEIRLKAVRDKPAFNDYGWHSKSGSLWTVSKKNNSKSK